MRIFIDMDDICVELLDEWTHYLNKISKYHREPEDIKDWDMKLAYPDLPVDCLYKCLYEVWFWENIKPVKNAYKYMKLLIEEGHEIYIATASTPKSLSVKTQHCLFNIFDFLPSKQVISIYNKALLDGDILFDDYHENLRNFKGVKIMRDAAYNRNCDEECYHFRVSRDNSWEEFYAIIKELERVKENIV